MEKKQKTADEIIQMQAQRIALLQEQLEAALETIRQMSPDLTDEVMRDVER